MGFPTVSLVDFISFSCACCDEQLNLKVVPGRSPSNNVYQCELGQVMSSSFLGPSACARGLTFPAKEGPY